MPDTYIQDVKKVIDALSKDEGLILEEKVIMLGIVMDYIRGVSEELESELDSKV